MKFWGVRGSIPTPQVENLGFGGNTPCLEVRCPGLPPLIFDGGSGLRRLGVSLLDEFPSGGECWFFLSHFHWDHIQGLPFLAQLYAPGWKPRIFAPLFESSDATLVGTIFQSPFFPVPYERLPNTPVVEMVKTGELIIGSFELSAIALNHPGGALGFRVRGTTGDLVYATDHEFGNPHFDEPLAAFVRDAAAIVLDSHFTPDEMPDHAGWGHSDWRTCARFAASNNVGGLWLFHHKPGRTDEDLVRIRADAKRIFAATETAAEGDALRL